MNVTSIRVHLLYAALLFTPAGSVMAADSSSVRAVIQPENERKAAPDFALKDGSSKTIKLKKFRGKVVLLDFWATWCTGCKQEIPWFAEFERIYGAKGFAVVGVSLDEGWKVLKPFLAETKAPYKMLLGDDPTARQYEIKTLPDTFLIDRQGRIAAAYRGGLVDKDDVETNIKTLLSKR